MAPLRLACGVTALFAWLVFVTGSAEAAPVTLDFETGAGLSEAVTSQYGPPGTPAGPTFKRGTEAGFQGIECGPPHLVNAYKAHRAAAS